MRFFALWAILIGAQFFMPNAYAESDEAAIRAERAATNASIAAHDADAFAAFFEDDYIITYGSSGKELNRPQEMESIHQMFRERPDVLYVRTPTVIEISSALPLAMEQGTWVGTWTDENGAVEYSGSYAAGWRKTDGTDGPKWKIHSELFVTLSCTGADCP